MQARGENGAVEMERLTLERGDDSEGDGESLVDGVIELEADDDVCLM